MEAIVVREVGGPEVLQSTSVDVPEPGFGEVRVRLSAVGVNFIDVYHRTGLYPLDPPFTPGQEGAGVVAALGPGVTEFAVGERVAYAMQLGSYAEQVVIPADRLVAVPDGVALEDAAAVMLQGMTAHYLVHSTYAVQQGDTVLVHAAAGGVGLLLVQMASRAGARVIGTASTHEKARMARDAGAEHVILYSEQDFQAEARRLTGGKGLQVVYDSVGKTTFLGSLHSLAPRGMLVLFGQSSGPVDPLDPALLAKNGSLFLTRPSLAHYTAFREELVWRAGSVLNALVEGTLRLRIDRTYPLTDAAEAHRDLEGRRTSGKVLLLTG
jgi:NADPH:quinone reductase